MLMSLITSLITVAGTEINTYDIEYNKYSIGPVKDEGESTGNIAIVKYYESEKFNGSIEVIDYFVSYTSAQTINIVDEGEYNSFILEDYFTSTNKYVPKTAGDIYYSKVKQLYNNGPYSGNTAYKINTGNNNFKVLHLLYRFNPSFNKRINIVKILEDKEGNVKNILEDRGVEVNDLGYTADIIIGTFNLSDSIASNLLVTKEDVKNWEECKAFGISNGASQQVNVLEETITILLRYTEENQQGKVITLHENEISKRYSLIDLSKSGIIAPFSRYYNKVASEKCDYEYTRRDETHYCRKTCNRDYDNTNYSYTLNNTVKYENNFVWETRIKDNIASGNASNTNGFEGVTLNTDLDFILQRNYKDKVTIYPLHNDAGILSDMNNMGYEVDFIPKNTRIESLKETDTAKYWSDTFKTSWVCSVESTPDGEHVCNSHGVRDYWTQYSKETSGKSTSNLNSNYNSINNVRIGAFLGKSGQGPFEQTASNSIMTMGGINFPLHLSSTNNNSDEVEFYPYVKMTYETLENDTTDVYVTSENESSLIANNRIEIGVMRQIPNNSNLELESTQWNTSSKAQNALSKNGIKDKDSILPGGALYTLDKNSNKTLIGIRSYQTVLKDDMKPFISGGNIKTESEAKEEYRKFQDEARDVLSKYEIVQWIGLGVNKNDSDFMSNGTRKQVSGIGGLTEFEGNNLSTDNKYYLKSDSGVDKASLDITQDDTVQMVYGIYSDTDGNVYVSKDGTVIAEMHRSDSIDKLLKNNELDLLNTKTKVIENYIEAIDRDKGTDKDGNTWYNEAFDGIEVLVNEWTLEIGIDGKRTSVLDPKLCDSIESRTDAYNADKLRTSQFKVSTKSSSSFAIGKQEGYVGTLGKMVLRFNGINNLYKSKLFYIPNATVKDLN